MADFITCCIIPTIIGAFLVAFIFDRLIRVLSQIMSISSKKLGVIIGLIFGFVSLFLTLYLFFSRNLLFSRTEEFWFRWIIASFISACPLSLLPVSFLSQSFTSNVIFFLSILALWAFWGYLWGGALKRLYYVKENREDVRGIKITRIGILSIMWIVVIIVQSLFGGILFFIGD